MMVLPFFISFILIHPARYDLGEVIGRGSFAVVHLAQKRDGSEQTVAVKIIDKNSTLVKERHLVDEMRILAAARHPNIIQL